MVEYARIHNLGLASFAGLNLLTREWGENRGAVMKLKMFALFCSLLTPMMVFAEQIPIHIHPVSASAPVVGPDVFQTFMWTLYFFL
jgi:hypothetical protein